MSAIYGFFERREAASLSAAFFASETALTNPELEKPRRWTSPPVAFGHQKMPIAPEEGEEILPFRDAATRLAVTSAARLDNRPELFDALDIARDERKNLPDSRIILRAWQKWGRDCPRYLIGDYAFVIWDEKEKTLFCARDHIGVKPFYYSLTADYFIFASDIKGLLACPEVSDRLDEDFVIASLADKRFYLPDRTYFSSIRNLMPGHALTITPEKERLERYWFPENSKTVYFPTDTDYAENAREILKRAVADRLRTTEKVGVHLSGGLDSSSVTVLTARERKRRELSPPEVFSWQPPPDSAESTREHAQINAVCKQENLTPTYCPMNAEDILAILKKDPTREMIHITMSIEHTIQKQAAQRGVRLMLSGWGGDEVLSYDGRGYSAELLLRGRWWRLFREGRKHGSALNFIGRELFLLLFRDRIEGYKKLAARSLKAGNFTPSFIRPELKNQVKLFNIPCRQTSVRSTLHWLWTHGMLPYRMESWAAHGAALNIAYAYPLTDRRLMEFVIRLPYEQFVKGKWKRRIMRETMNGTLPDKVCWQPDKAEPVRVENGLTEVYKALGLAHREILASNKEMARARYFDMERLMKSLSPEVLETRPKQADIVRALQFLDF